MCATTVTCDEASDYVAITSRFFTQPTTVSYDINLESSTILTTSRFSVPPPCLSDFTLPALVGSLSSIIVLLVLTLLLTSAVFLVAWKKREKRAGGQCKKYASKFFKMNNV